MRYSPEHKQKTYDRIVEHAARSFRKKGVDNVSISGLMADAGLTHGGFYAHFKSKEDVLLVALERALSQTFSRLGDAANTPGGVPDRISALLGEYLSVLHRDTPDRGCALAALAAEAVRAEPRCRGVFADAIENGVDLLRKTMGGDDQENRSEALALVSLMVGAMLLSRATADSPLSTEILAAARKQGERLAVAD
ncbi:TetR/AcrR family transcriptional regulator [Arenimonas donghaensis]|uniref:HTH tetR-type domain-containing protein n=1 Tax=Arenimonas donghaensis DSM 18148 = HO3-R19 TaxID=1121014 RepID=A0A087MGN1_9GAMM|nr:TetR/AcrR family transcriptional regulator [Arenimonas donghaensis]KFL36034.1 hypothetical protein N788_05675 [Arenimonas donghaensis DSM 18148 = HO3-R19]